MLYVDSNFFSVFTFPLLSGNPETCLTEPHSIVLSEDAAKKYFATTDAVGKIMMVKEDTSFCSLQSNGCCKTLPAKFFHPI